MSSIKYNVSQDTIISKGSDKSSLRVHMELIKDVDEGNEDQSAVDLDLEDTEYSDPFFTFAGEINNKIRVQKVLDDMPRLLMKKYKIPGPARVPHELDEIDPKNLNCDAYKLTKLKQDRENMDKILTEVYVELAQSRTYTSLWNYCQEAIQNNENVEFLKSNHVENKASSRALRKQLRLVRNQQKSAIYDCDTVIEDLKSQIEDNSQFYAIKERFMMRWKNAQKEQHKLVIDETENVSTSSIRYYKVRSEEESMVHNDVEMFCNIAIQENLQQIEKMMEKYDKDTEKMDLMVQIANSDYVTILSKTQDLKNKFEEREMEIQEWMKFKLDRDTAEKYNADMTRSAIIVQAWWRGFIVRKQLGPYRPKKGRAARKKK